MIGQLPTELSVNGTRYNIRTHFQDVLTILLAFDDPELENNEKVYVCLHNLYEDFEGMPTTDYEEAFKVALAFIEHGSGSERGRAVRLMDWEQDEPLVFPAINRIAGFETRSVEYLHWWTFLGFFMEISDGVFSQVLSMRAKKSKGKPLEKWEREYWSANKGICVLKPKLSAEEQAKKDKLNALLG